MEWIATLKCYLDAKVNNFRALLHFLYKTRKPPNKIQNAEVGRYKFANQTAVNSHINKEESWKGQKYNANKQQSSGTHTTLPAKPKRRQLNCKQLYLYPIWFSRASRKVFISRNAINIKSLANKKNADFWKSCFRIRKNLKQ